MLDRYNRTVCVELKRRGTLFSQIDDLLLQESRFANPINCTGYRHNPTDYWILLHVATKIALIISSIRVDHAIHDDEPVDRIIGILFRN